jgi:outer membrane lipoprotein-sorting protein
MRRLVLAALGLLTLAAGPPQEPASILENMARANDAMTSLAARLEQKKAYPQLGIEDPPERGEFALKRKPDGKLLVRVEIREPETRIVTLSDRRFVLYQPRIKQALEGTVDEQGGGRAGTSFVTYFLGGLGQAGKDYRIAAVGEETIQNRATSHLRLTPKAGVRVLYRQIDLWVDREWWMPIQQEFTEYNQSRTTLRFEDLRLNPDLPDSHFIQKIPPGVERIRG